MPHRFLADAMFPKSTVEKLRSLGWDILRLQDLQGTARPKVGWSDAVVLSKAKERRRALLTINIKHFEQLHNKGGNHSGIVICKESRYPKQHAKQIDRELRKYTTLNGILIYVPPKNRPPISIRRQPPR